MEERREEIDGSHFFVVFENEVEVEVESEVDVHGKEAR